MNRPIYIFSNAIDYCFFTHAYSWPGICVMNMRVNVFLALVAGRFSNRCCHSSRGGGLSIAISYSSISHPLSPTLFQLSCPVHYSLAASHRWFSSLFFITSQRNVIQSNACFFPLFLKKRHQPINLSTKIYTMKPRYVGNYSWIYKKMFMNSQTSISSFHA